MKPIYYRRYSPSNENSFLIRYAEVPHTYDKFHYHNEYEILYNIENRGTRFIGDSIHRFCNGDLVLVGPNIPHYWHSDDIYYKGHNNLKARVILIQFKKSFLSNRFLDLPEMRKIQDLFMKAKRGIRFTGNSAAIIGDKISNILEQQSWKRLLSMIEILCLMSESEEYELLSSRGFTQASRFTNREKITDIFSYMISNYSRDLKLEEVAEKANMNPSAFCRYFKKSISKTYSEALNEIRIGFACKKIITSDKTISEISYDCGYMNVPYFNRVFKKVKGVTPQTYRRIHMPDNHKSA